jgi:hypothetical protein
MSKCHEVNQGRHPAGVQFFEGRGMPELGRPFQREGKLGVHGLLRPQRAIVVEHRDALGLADEVRRVRVGHGGQEADDRLF